ncbi:MAG: hypothetical protein JXQ87_04215 [Bacteroidia bacterium]
MEITAPLKIKEEEQLQLATHSFLNVVSIIESVCDLIEFELKEDGLLEENIKMAQAFRGLLANEHELLSALETLDSFESSFFEKLENVFTETQGAKENKSALEEYENLKSIFKVVRVRSAEMLARLKKGIEWKNYKIEDLEANFNQFFMAVEKNAKGHYHIVQNLASKDNGDYMVHFKINSLNEQDIYMPDVLVDIMRDLIANARKYTVPGGTITVGLLEKEDELVFSVQDTGMGIPKNEIEQVVEFGFRASNTGKHKTYGAGFGLTKAYQFVKNSGGRFWIDSVEREGTTIKLSVPKKVNLD